MSAPDRPGLTELPAHPAPSGAGSHVRAVGESAEAAHGATPAEGHAGRGPLRAVLAAVVVTLLACVLAWTFLARMYAIPSSSMEPGLRAGDRVVATLLTPEPYPVRRGDVVVFEDTKGWLPGGGHVIKRVVGLPGDTVSFTPGEGRLRVNGAAVDEPYLAEGEAPAQEAFEATVPAGRLWVLGDHRSASADSRAHRDGPGGGFVALDDVVGRARFVVWPLDRIGGAGADPESFADVPDAPGAGS